MKAQANERGKIEVGFKKAEDGWHIVKFEEGIDILKNKDGAISLDKKGNQLWKFPLVVEDENDESDGVGIDSIAAENSRGEQLVTDFLGATGLAAAFEKNFPGDVSVFEQKVIDKVKAKLPGQFMRVKTQQNTYKGKDGSEQIAVNIVGFGKMSDKIDDLEKDLFGGKKSGGKKEEKKAEPKVEDDDF